MDLTKYYPDIAAKYPAYVTQRELCEICRICPKTAYNLEQQGEIPYTIEQNHLIRSHKIKLTDILAYLYRRECRQEADSPYICAMRTFYDKHLSPYGTYWRLLERLTSGTTARFQFAKNIYSTYNQRVHFSPVWFPDGSYTVNTHVMDIWTPAGMLAMNLTDDVTISGSLYDDWHIAPGNS